MAETEDKEYVIQALPGFYVERHGEKIPIIGWRIKGIAVKPILPVLASNNGSLPIRTPQGQILSLHSVYKDGAKYPSQSLGIYESMKAYNEGLAKFTSRVMGWSKDQAPDIGGIEDDV